MDELDQLLQELSAPTPQEAPRPESVAQVQKVETVEAAKPQSVNFSELDDLMAGLGGDETTQSSAPAKANEKSTSSELDKLMADLDDGSSARTSVASQKPNASSELDSLMDDLSTSVGATTISSQGAGAGKTSSTVDNLLNELQGPDPSQAAQPESRKGELDNILNSLTSDVSASESGDYKGNCALCKKGITGEVVTALGKTWCKNHFACMNCRRPLGSDSFFERDQNPYCGQCYHDSFAPKCAYCDGPIRDKCINALGKTWHPDHFFCSQCGKHFAGGGFMEKDGKAYCEEDYFNMFAPKCGACEKPIMADCITALGRQWHPSCFACMECHEGFGGGQFFEYEGKPYCEKHYHLQRGSLCASCQKPITGRCITALNKRFHPEHFVCSFCMKQLAKGTFKENSGKPYCISCNVKLFG